MKRIAIFASGSGSNAENIYSYFKSNNEVSVQLIFTNKYDAFVIQRAKKLAIPVVIMGKAQFREVTQLRAILKSQQIDLIVLAGFLLLIPPYLIEDFPQRIVNIHPALLPAYGGKGMYGMNVHRAVKENEEKESGITVHYVNENYDEGEIILQASCHLDPADSAEKIQKRDAELEYEFYPQAIEKALSVT